MVAGSTPARGVPLIGGALALGTVWTHWFAADALVIAASSVVLRRAPAATGTGGAFLVFLLDGAGNDGGIDHTYDSSKYVELTF